MALDSFQQTDVATRLGPVRLWETRSPPDTLRPLVFAIPSILSATDDLVKLLENLGILADGCLMRLPSSGAAALSACSMPELSRLVGELIETRFPGRRVVLLGVSTGAVIALGARARNLARIVALEPPLVTGGLWPIVEPMRQFLHGLRDPVANAFVLEAFGVSERQHEDRNHLDALRDLNVPVDVMLGGIPLQPQRDLSRFPSLVGEVERQFLAALPRVRLHVEPLAGHNILGQALKAVGEVVQEACRRAGSDLSAERLRLDEPLLEAVPLAARNVIYCGEDAVAFADALQRINPKCDVVLLGDAMKAAALAGPPGGFDAVVLSHRASAEQLAHLVAVLRPSGHLVARWGAPDTKLATALVQNGLVLRAPVDESGTGIVRAVKAPPGGSVRPELFLETVACAPLMMDIRTRLPVQGLRSDPDLRILYQTAPFDLPRMPVDAPKILVLQRPAKLDLERWRPTLARAIREGWLVVLEFDDYPPLIAEVKGLPAHERDMLMFSYMHAVQTSTPPLVELFRPYSPEIALFPNAAFDLQPFPHGDRPPRIFYGAMIRGGYAVEVAASLGPAMAACPEAEIIVIGDRAVFDALPTSSKRYYEYMSFEGYLGLMNQCAISLSPIAALPLRETKSDAKFLDASRAGALTIASPTIYDRVIEHGVNGLLAAEVKDWAPLLTSALADQRWRERMAYAAWTYVRDERMFADQVSVRREWYFDLWARREALTEALMGRTPGLREAVSAEAR